MTLIQKKEYIVFAILCKETIFWRGYEGFLRKAFRVGECLCSFSQDCYRKSHSVFFFEGNIS